MASRKAQIDPATGAKNKSVFVASGVTLGITTRSKARATCKSLHSSADWSHRTARTLTQKMSLQWRESM
ncbi:hypothetical protein ACFX1T_042992 [Malus domestica]